MAPLRWLALLGLLTCVGSVKMRTELHINPVRRVLTLLQMMQKKVTEEGERSKELFDKYRCYCKKSSATLGKSVSDAQVTIPQLDSDLEAGSAEKAQLAGDIAQAQESRAAAQKTMAEAASIRKKEHDSFAKESAENKVNLAAMTKAVAALKKGAGAAFLQTSGAAVLRQFSAGADLADWDRRTLASFLTASQGSEDSQEDSSSEQDSGDIIGIVSQLAETLQKDIAEAGSGEAKAVADYNSLVAAKTKEAAAIGKELESKTARLGEVGVELVNLAQGLADSNKLLAQDQAFLADLTKGCDKQTAEWEERSRTRNDELVALSDTIEMLNDDAALHLFKKALPSASLMQVQMSSRQLLRDARQVLVASQPGQGPRDPRLNLISMAMRGRKVNFGKMQVMIDKMVALLGKEQKDDDSKKVYCKEELGQAEDEKKTLEVSISDTQKTIANTKDMVDTVMADARKLASEIKALDQAAAQATKQRQSENKAFQEEFASNNAAVEILNLAKKRMNKFYNPKLLQVPAKRHLESTTSNMDDTPADAADDEAAAAAGTVQDAFSFLQRSSEEAAPPPPPAEAGVYKKEENSGSVIGLLDTLIKNIKKQVTEMEFEEKDAQSEYEQYLKDSSEKHAADAKALSSKESQKADAEAALQKHHQDLKRATGEAVANAEYLQGLHKECDWMLQNFGVRQKARAAEVDSLKQAKAVLSGADYNFLQLEEVRHNLRRRSVHTQY